MVRGAAIGGLAGVALAAAGLVWASRTDQCYTAPQEGAFEGCSTNNLTALKKVKILGFGIGGGAFVGAILGYTYHVNSEEQAKLRK